MVDFRKWLIALAVVGLLLGISSSAAYAQGTAITCQATAVPNIVRAEGITELLGDLILNCTGGTPTAAGLPIPLQNVTITVGGTNITSRIVGSTTPGTSTYNASEALLLIDEPYPATPIPTGATKDVANPALNQLACLAINNTNCEVSSLGVGTGAAGSYNGSAGHFNVFQGVQAGANSINWLGVPIDAPGTAGTRIIRITNIRADASALSGGSTLVPTTISESVFVNGSVTININEPANGSVVGNVSPGLIAGLAFPGIPGAYQQCNSVNLYLTGGPFAAIPPTDGGIGVTATEGFAYSFKPQNYAQILTVAGGAGFYSGPGNPVSQDVLNFNYGSESGFTPDAALVDASPTEFPGFADKGTQITFNIAGLSSGVTLYAPAYVYLTGAYGAGTPVGLAVLTNAGSGSGAFTTGIPMVLAGAPEVNGPEVPVTSTSTTAQLIYEIWYSDKSVTETLSVPISVEYTSNTASNLPTPTPATSPTTVAVGFWPQTTPAVHTASATSPIPRFVQVATPITLFSISPCTCNLLFPFVTEISGFNTGVAIANTSSDPYMTTPQSGTVTLWYYGSTQGGGAAPPQATSTAIAAGQELVFDLLDGNPSEGIPAITGFQGYIIAQANFQYCHGFAFVSDVGAQKLAEGYLAINLDVPLVSTTLVCTNIPGGSLCSSSPLGLNRTANGGENEGH